MDIAAVAAAALRHISGVLNGRIKEDSRGRHICGGGRKEVQLGSPLPLFLGRLQEVIRKMRGDSRTPSLREGEKGEPLFRDRGWSHRWTERPNERQAGNFP